MDVEYHTEEPRTAYVDPAWGKNKCIMYASFEIGAKIPCQLLYVMRQDNINQVV